MRGVGNGKSLKQGTFTLVPNWSQRLSFYDIFYLFGNLRCEALIKAPSREISFLGSQRFVPIIIIIIIIKIKKK